MIRRFAIQTGTRVDEYGPGHCVDVRSGGAAHVLAADRTVVGYYAARTWTIMMEPFTPSM